MAHVYVCALPNRDDPEQNVHAMYCKTWVETEASASSRDNLRAGLTWFGNPRLQKLCKQGGLVQTGCKAELVNRLVHFYFMNRTV